jgi:hypothetical protein
MSLFSIPGVLLLALLHWPSNSSFFYPSFYIIAFFPYVLINSISSISQSLYWIFNFCYYVYNSLAFSLILWMFPFYKLPFSFYDYVISFYLSEGINYIFMEVFFWSKLFLAPLLLLNLTGANWAVTRDAERARIDRQTESWGQVCRVLRWRRTAASLLLTSIHLFIHSASFLYIYSLRPYSYNSLKPCS